MFVTNQRSAKLAEPGIGSLHDPTAFVAPQLTSVFVAPFLVVRPVGCNQLLTSLLQLLAQGVAIVAAVGNHAPGLLPWTTFRPGKWTSASVAFARLTSLGWRAKETGPVENAKPHRSAESTECLRNRLDSAPMGDLAYPVAASVSAATVQATPTAHPSAASAASS